MKIKNYSVELKSRSSNYYFEDRVNYTCQKAETMKAHFKGHNISGGYESLCRCIDNLCKDGQTTGWFNDHAEQVRIVYHGETIVTIEQIDALVHYAANLWSSDKVAQVFGRDEDCVREILADFIEEWEDIPCDDDGGTKEQNENLDLILDKYAKHIVEL